MTRISNLTALASADGGDTLPILDVSATTTKKITKTSFLSDIVDGTLIAAQAIKPKHVDFGVVDQTARDALTLFEGLTVFREDTDAYEVYDGSAWLTFDTKWQTYTPSIYFGATQWTIGNGTSIGRYFRCGKKVKVQYQITLGTTSSFGATGAFEISLPVNAETSVFVNTTMTVGQCRALNSGVASSVGFVNLYNSTRVRQWYTQYGSTPNEAAYITDAAPFTWGSTDVLVGNIEYQVA